MSKCQLCRAPAVWAWQPFGPDENPLSFATLGSHYRGFAVVKICEGCKARLQSGKEKIEFTHKGERYIWDGNTAQWLREKRS